MQRIQLILDILGALSVVAGALGALLPEGKPRDICQHLGLGLGRAVNAAKGKP